MVKVHGIRREMATGMKRFEGMDMDVGEQANGKETTVKFEHNCQTRPARNSLNQKSVKFLCFFQDGVSEDVIKTPNDSKDCEAKVSSRPPRIL